MHNIVQYLLHFKYRQLFSNFVTYPLLRTNAVSLPMRYYVCFLILSYINVRYCPIPHLKLHVLWNISHLILAICYLLLVTCYLILAIWPWFIWSLLFIAIKLLPFAPVVRLALVFLETFPKLLIFKRWS